MKEISKQFDFKKRESEIYDLWEKSGFFNPDNIKSSKKYCNVLPPPNANGELHLGHACGYTVMDIFGRFERMNGKKVLLLPGKDHAGIQTQVVFERKIKEERGVSRHELGREKFYEDCYDFCQSRSGYMRSQEKRIGISADWSREKFTLDPDVLKIALETFVKLYKDGLVYKGKRIINWCPRCATALSDVEVIHKERQGKLYYIKYPIKDSKEFLTVATTRPETMLGDTAVAVNPKDKRFLSFIGQKLILPLQEKEISVIADRRIDMEFGTGAVKITPAHDPLDAKIGKDHKLEEIQVINEKAQITEEGGKYAGLDVLVAREQIVKDLKELDLIEKEEDLVNNISICERCKTPIEPLISDQWFVKVDDEKRSLKKEVLASIKAGKIDIYPENFKKILINWFANLEDWCISRQIWWGPQFPVWYRGEEIYVGLEAPKENKSKGAWIRDENTLDTWFTSGQWPYTTLGYAKGKDYKNFYPTDMMIMGRDILFFWATKMLLLGTYRTGKVPFKNLYFTGLLLDKDGKKFSKSKGNGIDPLEAIDEFGADALRLSLVMDIAPGQDARIYEEKIESFRNFVTKLWNIFRYCHQSSEDFRLVEKISKKDLKTLADKWIVSELEETALKTTQLMKEKNISLAQDVLRKFTWDSFAAWYVEINKLEKNTKVLGYVLDRILKMWHPFTPYVTEEIFSILNSGEKILMVSVWPKSEKRFISSDTKKNFADLVDLITSIRNIRSIYRIDPAQPLEVYCDKKIEKEIVEKLARVQIEKSRKFEKKKMIKISTSKRSVYLDIAKSIDIEKELENARKEIGELETLIAKNEGMLKNKNFVAGAPKEIVEATKSRIGEYQSKLKAKRDLEKDLEKL
ncbi:MAG TPA: valine--tRNA ligase [Candidatus Moranbacteria bacterium]|nr:valine--tRNA ligase [Candidatus Moranbacteria bacterium]